MSKLQREREKQILEGHIQEREISLGLALDPVRMFWLPVLCWSMMMAVEMSFCMANDGLKSRCRSPLEGKASAVLKGKCRGLLPLEQASQRQDSPGMGSLGCSHSNVHNLARMGIPQKGVSSAFAKVSPYAYTCVSD